MEYTAALSSRLYKLLCARKTRYKLQLSANRISIICLSWWYVYYHDHYDDHDQVFYSMHDWFRPIFQLEMLMGYSCWSLEESIKELDKPYQLGTSLQVSAQSVHLCHATRYSGLHNAIISVHCCLSFYSMKIHPYPVHLILSAVSFSSPPRHKNPSKFSSFLLNFLLSKKRSTIIS